MDKTTKQHQIFTVEHKDEGKRADVFLAEMLPSLSRTRIQDLIKNEDARLNGRAVKSGKRLEEGDRLTCIIPPLSPLEIDPVSMDLSFIYEDDCFLVINKPQGLVVHPAPGYSAPTLVHGLLANCRDLSRINGVLRPGIVHRLDKDTSGLLVVAKNDISHRSLAGQLQTGLMKRQYLATVWGTISEPAGLIDAPISRDSRDRQKMTAAAGGKEARTYYTVLDRLSDKTVVQCDLLTGRTHQIRVHMKLLGYPVVGDQKYGRRKDDPSWPGQALHAWRLQLSHPVNGLDMTFFAPPPEHYIRFLVGEKAAGALSRMKEIERETNHDGY